MKVKAKKNTVRKLTTYAKAVAGVISTLAMAVEAVDTVRHWLHKPMATVVAPMVARGEGAMASAPVLVDAAHPSKSLYVLALLVVAVPTSIYLVHWLGHHLEQRADEG